MSSLRVVVPISAILVLLPSSAGLSLPDRAADLRRSEHAAAEASQGVDAYPRLPMDQFSSDTSLRQPVDNAAFASPDDALAAPAFSGTLTIDQTRMRFKPRILQPICDGSPVELGGSCRGGDDKRLFPGITLDLFTVDDRLAARQVGAMVKETEKVDRASYWRVIPQYGRVWRDEADNGWSRAAFPLMLVHDMENHAHQGLAMFMYKGAKVSDLRFQFVQQSTPWNIPRHFVSWGSAEIDFERGTITDLPRQRARVQADLADRLPTRPWSELGDPPPDAGVVDDPIPPGCVVARAVVRDGVVYYRTASTPYGPYPYPEEMRFGPRSVTKSITASLALGRLAEVYGPYILELKIGDYVDGLDPEYDEVRFIDAANMATGMGGAGTPITNPNNPDDGYVDSTYDDWYNGAFSNAEKIEAITRDASPYPWGPGRIMRYRDRDYHLLGAAVDGFLKSVRGADVDIWTMLENEVFTPIGVHHAPIVKTLEPGGVDGLPWFHAGVYVTLDDLAKIFTLLQNEGSYDGDQLLHRELTEEIFSSDWAITKYRDQSVETAFSGRAAQPDPEGDEELYKMGFHLMPYEQGYIPTASGFAGNYIVMYPDDDRLVSIRMAKAWPAGEC